MKTFFRILGVQIGMIISVYSSCQGILPDSIVKKLETGVEGFKGRYHSPGIIAVVVHDNKIVFSEALGYTDLEQKIPVTLDSRFPILSVTKTFTATMLMQLVQRNQVDLNDDVKTFLPELRGNLVKNSQSGITLFQLATHTSGLPRNSPADIGFTKQVDQWVLGGAKYSAIEASSKKAFLNSLRFMKSEFPKYPFLRPGDRKYSNLGYSMLGIALERAAKTDYATYVVENICKPLKMFRSGFLSGENQKQIAKGYFYDDSIKSFREAPVFIPLSALYAGGMYSTASDLASFLVFQFDSKSAEYAKILTEDNKAMMRAFNIGWRSAFPFVMHEGSMLGHRCEIVLNPTLKLGWIILTNTTDFDFSLINNYFSQLLVPLFDKQPLIELEKFTGIYELPGNYDRLEIHLKNGSLYSTYLKDELTEQALIPFGINKFNGPGKGGYTIGYEFISDENSAVKALVMGQLMWIKK